MFYLTLCLLLTLPAGLSATTTNFGTETSITETRQESSEIQNQSAKTEYEEAIVAFPNPSNRVIKLSSDPIHKVEIVEIFHISGEHLLSLESNGDEEISIDMGIAPPGIYVCRISNTDGPIETLRLIKE